MNEIKLFDYDKFVVKYSEENEDSLKKKKRVINKKGKMLKKKKNECERGRNRE